MRKLSVNFGERVFDLNYAEIEDWEKNLINAEIEISEAIDSLEEKTKLEVSKMNATKEQMKIDLTFYKDKYFVHEIKDAIDGFCTIKNRKTVYDAVVEIGYIEDYKNWFVLDGRLRCECGPGHIGIVRPRGINKSKYKEIIEKNNNHLKDIAKIECENLYKKIKSILNKYEIEGKFSITGATVNNGEINIIYKKLF